MLENLIQNSFFPFATITLFVWATYFYTLRCGWVSDDIQGIAEFDGKLQGYEYGHLWRWLRYNLAGGNRLSAHKDSSGNFIPNGKVPSHHHLISIILFNFTCVAAYLALEPTLGSKVALMAILILIVHPCSTQGVSWVSGLAYPLSLLWMSLIIILTRWFYSDPTLTNAVWVIPLFCILQWLAIHAIFATTSMLWIILLFLGYWQFAILGLAISTVMCFDEIRKIVSLRVSEFKKQHMAESTVFNWRKPIVAIKTFYYYVKHSLTPIRMGLYHEFGFHYSDDLERMDLMFLCGLIVSGFIGWVFFSCNDFNIQFGILWYVVFMLGFANFITAQQFITERYIMISNLGLGIVIATLTQNYIWLYAFILGCYLCRTWTHLPTYDNELRFYQSNHWNFQKSEVALGNLGVTYARIGMADSARETWQIASQINPDYDVPHVNIFYQYRSTAQLMINNGDYEGGIKKMMEAIPFLERALASKVCHFPEHWRKEHQEILTAVRNPSLILEGELARLMKLQEDLKGMLRQATTPQRAQEVSASIESNKIQMQRLMQVFSSNRFPIFNQSIFHRYNSEVALNNLTRR